MAIRDISIDNAPLSEKIAETIRDYILKGVLKPGERLTEPKLSDILGISRTPIREALRILEMDGFVTIIPRRGAVVTDVTDKDVDEIFVLKIRLESLAARLAVENMLDADIDKLRDINAKLERFNENKNVAGLIKANSDFHDFFIRKSENQRLIKFLESLQSQFKRATAYSFTEAGRIVSVIEEHKEIVEAFEKRDVNLVEKLVERHIQNGWKFIKSKVAKKKTS
ncbi:GntR family transcriptional regulator [Deferribacter autotrophicus]|uniref:GntR family transcriptional regulator n=1 Tax=Deferribacter autotrophicus TaxID=500465 RepID=A0A5A8EZ52_9BACT|nr:GntR family transcriptional regulator [Deferribacter autotrophicus]KAA0256931.1 GntR family transcriptional regulator [Deferribacter autotrophicus]